MTEQTKQRLKYWLIGIFTGGGIAAPVTAFICKKVYDKKVDEAETRGMNAMAAYAVQQQTTVPGEVITERDENGKPIAGRYPYEELRSKKINGTDETIDNSVYTGIHAYNVMPDDDINNYDVTIDDIEATEEARERTEAHERYLEMIDKYKNPEELRPRKINGDDFLNEQYMQKSYVNWYEQDNVFEEELNVIEDPYATFGVTDGRELFKNPELRLDADIVYVRNEKLTTDFEISRIHGSYAEMVGGESGLGETDT